MKYWIALLLFSGLFSCNNGVNQRKELEKQLNAALDKIEKEEREKKNGIPEEDICWQGKLNGKTPVFIHYQIDNDLAIGEIIYLETRLKEPIRLIGEIDDNMSYRLLEFDKTGNITGVLTGEIFEGKMTGTWFSPKTRKELNMELASSDSIIKSPDIKAVNLSGKYNYHYGKEGYSGSFNVSKIKDDKYAFDVFSVTDAPARNIALVESDTVEVVANYFNYLVPNSEDCKFKVRFFKDFVFINYIDGSCTSQFGHNATVEGVYLKVK